MLFVRTIGVLCLAFMSLFPGRELNAEPLKLYIDADYSITRFAAESIELGVSTALEELDYLIGGQKVEVVARDHRENSKRSRLTIKRFLEDEQALAMIGGMQSPPYLTYRNFINQNGVLTLLPWSAAGPITRADKGDTNWLFRLSIDDNKAGPFLVEHAVHVKGCKAVGLILMDTGWGRANQKSMSATFKELGLEPASVIFFPSVLGNAAAEEIGLEVRSQGVDCAIMLSTANAAIKITHALYKHNKSLHLSSHWGILGGSYPEAVPDEMRTALSLEVIQTCGLQVEQQGSEVLKAALRRTKKYQSLSEMPAPVGFVHGYDIIQILAAAAEQAAKTVAWKGAITNKRNGLRIALEKLEKPVKGILKTYNTPFQPYGTEANDAHEALGEDEYCMAVYDEDGHLVDSHNHEAHSH